MITTIAARRRREIKQGRRTGGGLIVRLGEDDELGKRRRYEGHDSRIKVEVVDVIVGAGLMLLWGFLWGHSSGFGSGAQAGAEAGVEIGHEVGYCDGFNDATDFAEKHGAESVRKISIIARAALESGTARSARAAVFDARAAIVRGTLNAVTEEEAAA